MGVGNKWSDEEEDYICKNAAKLTGPQLLEGLNPISQKNDTPRTLNGTLKKVRKMGMRLAPGKQRTWTTKERAYLLEHYGKQPTNELAAYFKTTVKSVQITAFRMRKKGGKSTGRPRKLEMIQETPWKKYLTQILAVAEWFDSQDIAVAIRTEGELMAVFRADVPQYVDKPEVLYDRFVKEGKLKRESFRVCPEGRPYGISGGFNAMVVGQPINYEY